MEDNTLGTLLTLFQLIFILTHQSSFWALYLLIWLDTKCSGWNLKHVYWLSFFFSLPLSFLLFLLFMLFYFFLINYYNNFTNYLSTTNYFFLFVSVYFLYNCSIILVTKVWPLLNRPMLTSLLLGPFSLCQ